MWAKDMKIFRLVAASVSLMSAPLSTADVAKAGFVDLASLPRTAVKPAPWLEDRSIQSAIRSANHGVGQILFAFGDDTSCHLFSPGLFSYDAIHFGPAGMDYTLSRPDADALGLSMRLVVIENDYLATLSTSTCRMRIIVEKLVRDDGIWTQRKSSISPGDAEQWSNQRRGEEGRGHAGADHFMFKYDVSDGESCPSGGGSVLLYPNILVSEFGEKFKGRIAKGAGSATERSYAITGGNCRYTVSASMESLSQDHPADPLPARNYDAFEYRRNDGQP